jgi:predicted dinucleotide-utilizing enzyme
MALLIGKIEIEIRETPFYQNPETPYLSLKISVKIE